MCENCRIQALIENEMNAMLGVFMVPDTGLWLVPFADAENNEQISDAARMSLEMLLREFL